jgi:hypothetical protein
MKQNQQIGFLRAVQQITKKTREKRISERTISMELGNPNDRLLGRKKVVKLCFIEV